MRDAGQPLQSVGADNAPARSLGSLLITTPLDTFPPPALDLPA